LLPVVVTSSSVVGATPGERRERSRAVMTPSGHARKRERSSTC